MNIKSIMWADGSPKKEALMPRFFIDLNLDQVISKINSLRKNYDIKDMKGLSKSKCRVLIR